jgi:hypothetical protein
LADPLNPTLVGSQSIRADCLVILTVAALNDYLEKMGFPEFRVEEAEQVPGQIRHFVAPEL